MEAQSPEKNISAKEIIDTVVIWDLPLLRNDLQEMVDYYLINSEHSPETKSDRYTSFCVVRDALQQIDSLRSIKSGNIVARLAANPLNLN